MNARKPSPRPTRLSNKRLTKRDARLAKLLLHLIFVRDGLPGIADALYISPYRALAYVKHKPLDRVQLDLLQARFTPTELAHFRRLAWRTRT